MYVWVGEGHGGGGLDFHHGSKTQEVGVNNIRPTKPGMISELRTQGGVQIIAFQQARYLQQSNMHLQASCSTLRKERSKR